MSGVTRTVYGIYYPETRRIVEALWAERPHAWYEQNYTGRQDPLHRPCLEGWRAWASEAGVTLGRNYVHEYPTAGANEAIHALLALHRAGGGQRIHTFAGEYEGYWHTATGLGLEVVTHARAPDGYRASLARQARGGDQFWLSAPSAIDGNLWPGFDDFCQWLPQGVPGLQLIVDLTYVGAVAIEPRLDLDREPIVAALWSLSKPFGVYYHRIGGLVSRAEVPTLRGHHWFKNLFSVNLGARLMAAHPARQLPARYQARQTEAIALAKKEGEMPLSAGPSHVVMLAHAPLEPGTFADYTRGAGLRFCVSPTMDRLINP